MLSVTDTYYNEDRQIWQGPRAKHFYGPDVTLAEAALFALSRNPAKIVQVMDTTGEELTAGQLLRDSKLMARNLLNLGLKRGDVLCLPVYNSTQLSAVVMAGFLCGLPINAIHPKSDKELVVKLFTNTKPKLIFCETQNYLMMKEIALEMKMDAKVFLLRGDIDGAPHVNDLLVDDGSNLENIRFPCADLTGDDTAVILNSSGTTGTPKCICCSHNALLNRQIYTDVRLEHVLFSFSPLMWVSGILTLIKSFLNCVKRIITDRDYSVDYLFELVQTYDITHFMVVPWQLNEIMHKAKTDPRTIQSLASVRTLYAGGAKVAPTVLAQMNTLLFNDLPKIGITSAYGMAEVASVISVHGSELDKRCLGSEGKLSSNTDARIVSNSGELLDINKIGILHIRTPCKWAGYYGAPELTKRAYQDGWVITGDLAYFDADGFLHVCGREADIFLCRGTKVYAVLIENVILELPGVMEACVFYVPEKDVVACAVIRSNDAAGQSLDTAAIRRHTSKLDAAQQLKGGVYFVHSLPRTSTAKVQRDKVWATIKATGYLSDANNNGYKNNHK